MACTMLMSSAALSPNETCDDKLGEMMDAETRRELKSSYSIAPQGVATQKGTACHSSGLWQALSLPVTPTPADGCLSSFETSRSEGL